MTAQPNRFEITGDEIDRVMRIFYARVRKDPDLGPVFGKHVTDWEAHEAKIGRFWRGVILREPGFEGSPMRAHLQAREVKVSHFPIWLGLFDQVLAEELSPEQAEAWSVVAHRIGKAQAMGVEGRDRDMSAPPKLF